MMRCLLVICLFALYWSQCQAQYGYSGYHVEVMKGNTNVYYFDSPAANYSQPTPIYYRVVFSGMASNNYINVGMYPYPILNGCTDRCGCKPNMQVIGSVNACCVNGYNQGIDFYFWATNVAIGPGIYISCLDAPGCCGFQSCQFQISWAVYFGSDYNPNMTKTECYQSTSLNYVNGCPQPMLLEGSGGKAISCGSITNQPSNEVDLTPIDNMTRLTL